MNAFNGDEIFKTNYLAGVRPGERGCAPVDYPDKLGIPEHISWIGGFLCPSSGGAAWRERLLRAIPVGADLTGAWQSFAHWLLADPTYGITQVGVTLEGDSIIAIVALADDTQRPPSMRRSRDDWERHIAYAKRAKDTMRERGKNSVATDATAEAVVWLLTAHLEPRWVPEALSWVGAAWTAVDAYPAWTEAACDRVVEIVMTAPKGE